MKKVGERIGVFLLAQKVQANLPQSHNPTEYEIKGEF